MVLIKISQMFNGKYSDIGTCPASTKMDAERLIRNLETEMLDSDKKIYPIKINSERMLVINLDHGPVKFVTYG